MDVWCVGSSMPDISSRQKIGSDPHRELPHTTDFSSSTKKSEASRQKIV